jgi:inward rectifier potassium channel
MRAEFIILLQGYDETFAQDVHTNGSYTCDEIIWNARFQLMYFSKDGHTELKLDRIDDIVKLEETITEDA